MTDAQFDQPFPLGPTNDKFAQYFIGQSYLAPVVDGPVPVNNVTFEPGCRNNWHVHHGEGVSNEWLEPVTDEVYGRLPKDGESA